MMNNYKAIKVFKQNRVKEANICEYQFPLIVATYTIDEVLRTILFKKGCMFGKLKYANYKHVRWKKHGEDLWVRLS